MTLDPMTKQWAEIRRTASFWSLFWGYDADGFTEASVSAPMNAATTRELSRPVFEPDFNYVAYQLQWKGKGTTSNICRETGSLGAKALTPGVKRVATGEVKFADMRLLEGLRWGRSQVAQCFGAPLALPRRCGRRRLQHDAPP